MNRRRIFLQGTAAAFALSAVPPSLMAAERYQRLKVPVPQEAEGRIEVIEFFHYGCPHCRNFHPLLQAWKKKLPEDVAFRAVPAIWGNEQLRGLARLYYALERSGTLEGLENDIFKAVQDDKRPIFDADGVRAWLEGRDVDVDLVMETYESFAVQGLVQRADQIARAYRIQGVPTMAVGGRYTTSATLTGSHAATLEVVDELIARVRGKA
ncbi:thiol:disulfide interchange protein DsbA/DsbL [Pseudazoarcus pumilus]|uniref:Thiol:disulfide interchange protein n=1 Tax=Pseudazoarcus pumilus TaxID=2067960 RepID=A0A2I6S3J6_9RHOO|nr:thiol:disulfide interchange protein DsbA/DsbL [Pseudazoarcus pumilus]AUN93832.1 twin-arginine translocation pathway signal protein [Pseudazoarcus pumilus]